MKIRQLFIMLIVSIPIFSCCIPFGTSDSAGKTEEKKKEYKINKRELNGVELTEKGLEIVSLYFTVNDKLITLGDTLISDQRPTLHLNIKGWDVKDGKIKAGAGIKLFVNTAESPILHESDLFDKYDHLSESDATNIELSSYSIYEAPKFRVEFIVWDKTTNAEVRGKYFYTVNW